MTKPERFSTKISHTPDRVVLRVSNHTAEVFEATNLDARADNLSFDRTGDPPTLDDLDEETIALHGSAEHALEIGRYLAQFEVDRSADRYTKLIFDRNGPTVRQVSFDLEHAQTIVSDRPNNATNRGTLQALKSAREHLRNYALEFFPDFARDND